MSSSVSSYNPSTYLSQLLGNKPLTAVANTLPVTTDPTPQTSGTSGSSSTTGSASSTTSTSSPSDLLGLSPTVLALLQGTSSSSSNNILSELTGSGVSEVSELLGGSGTATDPLEGALLAQDTSALPTETAVNTTQEQQTQTSENTSPIQSLINNYNATQNTNTAALVQGAQSLLQSFTA